VFLRLFRNFITKRVGTHEDYAELLSLSALATTVGKKVVLETKVAPLQLNLFVLFVGPSGLARKTLPLRFYLNDVLRELETEVEDDVQFRIPPNYSTEGLKNYFTQVVTEQGVKQRDSGVIIRDEFTSLFKQTYHKKYMSDQLEFLSQLYDGWIPPRQTVKHGLQSENFVCVNMVACTTPYLFTVMRPEFFFQGTGNRFLFVLDDASSLELMKPEDPDTYFFKSEISGRGSERENKVEDFAKLLKKYYENTRDLTVFVERQASKVLTDYKFIWETKAKELYLKDRLDAHYSYIVRMPEFAYKISVLKCIDRECGETNKDSVEVNLEDTKYARSIVFRSFQHFENMMKLWEEVERRERIKVKTSDIADLKGFLADRGGRATRTEVLRYLGISAFKLNNILQTLYQTGEIKVVQEDDPHKPGKKAQILVLQEPQMTWFKKESDS